MSDGRWSSIFSAEGRAKKIDKVEKAALGVTKPKPKPKPPKKKTVKKTVTDDFWGE